MAQARKVKAPTPRADSEAERRRMREILRVLHQAYPEAQCSLNFRAPFELLVATILSAQCTDERVNLVTPALFRKFGTPAKMAKAELSEIEELIRSTGFFKNKALALKGAAQTIMESHGGKVPGTMEELTHLRGVGRKTANVVLGNVFGVPSLVVDTHVLRVSRRLGFTDTDNAVKVEQELMRVVPREQWTDYAHLIIFHGREVCTGRRAYCERCPVARLCPKIGVA